MPLVMAWIGRVLLSVAGEFVVRAIIGAGVGIATYHFVVAPVRQQIAMRLSVAGDLAQYVGFLGIDTAITIILSAWVGRTAVNSAKAFFVKKAS
ncbi:DUF2523 family protein [Aerosticca soli]|uniref:DUF2523 family protein n=1 Tax=Aerosticca soli TaxID=2010829 RepID=UPI000F846293|nr:DUF2523 family protein [Aerosticca soli]